MRFAPTAGLARRVLSRAATSHAAGLLAKEYAAWCHKAGFRATPYGLSLDGQRVPRGTADWAAFEAGRNGEPEPVLTAKRRRRLRRAA